MNELEKKAKAHRKKQKYPTSIFPDYKKGIEKFNQMNATQDTQADATATTADAGGGMGESKQVRYNKQRDIKESKETAEYMGYKDREGFLNWEPVDLCIGLDCNDDILDEYVYGYEENRVWIDEVAPSRYFVFVNQTDEKPAMKFTSFKKAKEWAENYWDEKYSWVFDDEDMNESLNESGRDYRYDGYSPAWQRVLHELYGRHCDFVSDSDYTIWCDTPEEALECANIIWSWCKSSNWKDGFDNAFDFYGSDCAFEVVPEALASYEYFGESLNNDIKVNESVSSTGKSYEYKGNVIVVTDDGCFIKGNDKKFPTTNEAEEYIDSLSESLTESVNDSTAFVSKDGTYISIQDDNGKNLLKSYSEDDGYCVRYIYITDEDAVELAKNRESAFDGNADEIFDGSHDIEEVYYAYDEKNVPEEIKSDKSVYKFYKEAKKNLGGKVNESVNSRGGCDIMIVQDVYQDTSDGNMENDKLITTMEYPVLLSELPSNVLDIIERRGPYREHVHKGDSMRNWELGHYILPLYEKKAYEDFKKYQKTDDRADYRLTDVVVVNPNAFPASIDALRKKLGKMLLPPTGYSTRRNESVEGSDYMSYFSKEDIIDYDKASYDEIINYYNTLLVNLRAYLKDIKNVDKDDAFSVYYVIKELCNRYLVYDGERVFNDVDFVAIRDKSFIKDFMLAVKEEMRILKQQKRLDVKKNESVNTNESTENLLTRIDNIMYDFDPYEYNDQYESREDGIDSIRKSLSTKDGLSSVISTLKNIYDEYVSYGNEEYDSYAEEVEKVINDISHKGVNESISNDFPSKILVDTQGKGRFCEYTKLYVNEDGGCYYTSDDEHTPMSSDWLCLYPDGKITVLFGGREHDISATAVVKSYNKVSESIVGSDDYYEDDYDDYHMSDYELDVEHTNLYGGDPTYCHECGSKLIYTGEDSFCPECDGAEIEAQKWENAQAPWKRVGVEKVDISDFYDTPSQMVNAIVLERGTETMYVFGKDEYITYDGSDDEQYDDEPSYYFSNAGATYDSMYGNEDYYESLKESYGREEYEFDMSNLTGEEMLVLDELLTDMLVWAAEDDAESSKILDEISDLFEKNYNGYINSHTNYQRPDSGVYEDDKAWMYAERVLINHHISSLSDDTIKCYLDENDLDDERQFVWDRCVSVKQKNSEPRYSVCDRYDFGPWTKYESISKTINIRERLLEMDNSTYNTLGLLSLYESKNWSKDDKKKIAKMIYENASMEHIYKFLYENDSVDSGMSIDEKVKDATNNYKNTNGSYVYETQQDASKAKSLLSSHGYEVSDEKTKDGKIRVSAVKKSQ